MSMKKSTWRVACLHPAPYVLDKQGIVRWRFIETDYRKRHSNAQILEALRKIT